MKVSFILPIYNVEMYLGECIESLLVQTYTNFEIVLAGETRSLIPLDFSPPSLDSWDHFTGNPLNLILD